MTIVSGLNSPRHMAFGPDGTLYIAEAGTGGTQPCIDSPQGKACFGATGSVTKVAPDGTVSKLVDGLPSTLTGEGPQQEVVGPSGVALDAQGDLYLTIGGGSTPELRSQVGSPLADHIGWLVKVGADGALTPVTDMVAWESQNNPDKDQPSCQAPGQCGPTTGVDSNVNGVTVAPDGTVLVVDAAGNSLLSIDASGTPSLVATFPVTMVPVPAGMMPSPAPDGSAAPGASVGAVPQMPVQAVPTAVEVGPDGAYYVSFLTGFPFPKGGAWVARVEPGKDPTVYAKGFTNAVDLAFAPDGSLYVLEISHEGLASGDPTGGLWKVPAGGGDPQLVMTDGLVMPGGLAVDKDGSVYVAQPAVAMGQGSVIKIAP